MQYSETGLSTAFSFASVEKSIETLLVEIKFMITEKKLSESLFDWINLSQFENFEKPEFWCKN